MVRFMICRCTETYKCVGHDHWEVRRKRPAAFMARRFWWQWMWKEEYVRKPDRGQDIILLH